MRRAAVDQQRLHQQLPVASGMHSSRDNPLTVILSILGLLIIIIWSYWPTITGLFTAWQTDDNYSAGQIVPLIAVYLLWRQRKVFRGSLQTPGWYGWIALILLAEATRTYGYFFMRPWVEKCSLLLIAGGFVVIVAGWKVFRQVLWIVLFLFLMVPLPGRVHNLISPPLQSIATTGSVFLLEAFGTSVSRQGNIIMLNGDTPLGVAEACSGLRMLVAFVIAAAFIAYLVKRPRWQKAVLLASSIPVAVICNVIRIFITALLMLYLGSEVGQKFFHDIGGYVMIAIAVSLLFGEIRLMDRLIVSEPNTQPGQVIVSAHSVANS